MYYAYFFIYYGKLSVRSEIIFWILWVWVLQEGILFYCEILCSMFYSVFWQLRHRLYFVYWWQNEWLSCWQYQPHDSSVPCFYIQIGLIGPWLSNHDDRWYSAVHFANLIRHEKSRAENSTHTKSGHVLRKLNDCYF